MVEQVLMVGDGPLLQFAGLTWVTAIQRKGS